MNRQELRADIINRFHVSPVEAERMIDEQEGRSLVRQSVARARAGGIVGTAQPNYDEEPGEWRQEVQRRLMALDVLEDGVQALEKMARLVARVVEMEKRLIQSKRAKVQDRHCDWWDFQHSGWAMGGREMFAKLLTDLLRNLDEQKLAGQVMDRLGFKRVVPLPEILPDGTVQLMAASDAVPRDHVEFEAALVRGAKGAE